jgi:hypothetical protein
MADLATAHALYDGPWRSAKDPDSTLIYRWAYIRQTGEFLVRFYGNTTLYVYRGVSLKTVNNFVDAQSRGRYFNRYIKGKYRYMRIVGFFRRMLRKEFSL